MGSAGSACPQSNCDGEGRGKGGRGEGREKGRAGERKGGTREGRERGRAGEGKGEWREGRERGRAGGGKGGWREGREKGRASLGISDDRRFGQPGRPGRVDVDQVVGDARALGVGELGRRCGGGGQEGGQVLLAHARALRVVPRLRVPFVQRYIRA